MDPELQSILTSAASEAQGRLGELFTGCDGEEYTGTFRAPTAFQMAQAGLEMQEAGFRGTTFLLMTATKAQFMQPPWSWRRNPNKVIRSAASPVQKGTVVSVNADSPLFYAFVLQVQQPEAG